MHAVRVETRLGIVAAVVVLLGLSPLLATADIPAKKGQEITSALATVDSLLSVDPAAALGSVKQLHVSHGDDPLYGWQIRGRLAVALMAVGQPEEALPHLEYLVRRDPMDPVWHRNLAATLRVLGKRGRALTEYGVVVELAPRDFRARLEYGQYLLEFRNYNLAAHHLEEASRLCGRCDEAQRALINLYLARGDFAAAADPLMDIAQSDTSAALRRSLLVALSRSGRDEDLLGYLEERGIASLSAEEFRLVVDAEGNLGKDAHSQDFAETLDPDRHAGDGGVLRLPADAGFWGRVALNLLATEKYDDGLLAIDRAIALVPEDVTNRNNRVVLLQRLGREEEAAREWEEVLRLDPSLKQEKTP